MLNHIGDSVRGKTAVISGSGNVATYAAQKLIELGATVICMSDSSGFVYDRNGIDPEKLDFIKQLKEVKRGRINEYAEHFPGVEFHANRKPWAVPCHIAMPCATQNELDEHDANTLLTNGVQVVAEGANMPSTLPAVTLFRKHGILFGPAKAANAGGVAVSGLEQSQNALRLSWTAEEVNEKLMSIMHHIHRQCAEHGTQADGKVDYVQGANIAGFVKVADAMLAHGIN